jgi:hypothetical protein
LSASGAEKARKPLTAVSAPFHGADGELTVSPLK